jgi:hypothetical protein
MRRSPRGLVIAKFFDEMVERPYFEDERTVLTARPVTPLQQIDTKVKHRRSWILGGAFAAAMLLGAASALLSAYLKIRNAPDPQIQPQSVSLSLIPLPTIELRPERPKSRPKGKNIIKADETDLERSATRPRLSEDDELRRIRDAVLVDEWQERRQRRVERREERRERRKSDRRDLSHRSGRDLSNLDEIFEGRRRPY